MTDKSSDQSEPDDIDAAEFLKALLRISPQDAERAREKSPPPGDHKTQQDDTEQ